MNPMIFTLMGTYIALLFWISMVYFGFAAVVIYIVVRWRDSKGTRHDAQVGSKVVLHFLMSVSIFVTVSGGSVIVVDQLLRVITDGGLGFPASSSFERRLADPYDYSSNRSQPKSTKSKLLSPATRTGLGMVVAGTLMGLFELWLLHSRTNDRRWPAVRRSFVGSRTVVHGLIVTAAMTGAFVVGFQETTEMSGEIKKNLLTTCLGLLTVWGGSLAVHLALLFIYSRQSTVPGENFCCYECGEDLRGRLRTGEFSCPNCRSVLTVGLRRTLATLDGGYLQVQMQSTASSPETPPSPPEKDTEQSE
jgi:hypothetical protein